MMRGKQLIFTSIVILWNGLSVCSGEFLVDSLTMTDDEFEQCSTCDGRSEALGSRIITDKLREYMLSAPELYTKLVVDKGDVSFTTSFPNTNINTGHSCSRRAYAYNILGTSKMVPNSVVMTGAEYFDDVNQKYAFAGADVDWEFLLNANIKMTFGFRFFGKCKRLRSKTCPASASSRGKFEIFMILTASNIVTFEHDGKDFISFKLGADVYGDASDSSFSGLTYNRQGSCDFRILGIKVTVNSRLQKYANSYLNEFKKTHKLDAPKLMTRFEELMKAKLGERVSIPVNISGGKRRRRKRSTDACPFTCPSGWNRAGNSDKCIKFFGMTQPNCPSVYPNAVMKYDMFGGRKVYRCEINL